MRILRARVVVTFCAGFAMMLMTDCAGKAPPGSRPEAPPRPGHVERGAASWYGPTFHGRATANGERYNMLDLTAAHKTLPFNTYVRVTNLANAKQLIVRVNDRGPFIRGRIIDLSYAAAKILDIPDRGTREVRLEVVDSETGSRILKRELDLVRRKGVKTWTDRDFSEVSAAQ